MLYTRAGPEVGVASTKTFLAQIAANYLLGLALAQARGTKYPDEVEREYRELESMPELVAAYSPRWNRLPSWAIGSPRRRPSCSSGATSVTQWRWKAR
ncbi:putative glucosamine-fructose-6-phosphate aminotransferase [isomerizing] glmS [Mycobacterium xenopi 3993]|nr:putative glucosamine-fructose-6-phosphate aminotransferase [isomerizing] glmS [Mycobacterium xenopi 3993]